MAIKDILDLKGYREFKALKEIWVLREWVPPVPMVQLVKLDLLELPVHKG
jgi:hypothetical protein